MTLSDLHLLTGHVDETTALVVDDYPYGRRLRTQIRYWIETVRGKGDRFVSQTLNPKTGAWNKPKRSTYSPVGMMYREADTGYVRWTALRAYPDDASLADYAAHADLLADEQRRSLAVVMGRTEAFKHVTWTVREGKRTDAEKDEQADVMRAVSRAAATLSAKAYKDLTT